MWKGGFGRFLGGGRGECSVWRLKHRLPVKCLCIGARFSSEGRIVSRVLGWMTDEWKTDLGSFSCRRGGQQFRKKFETVAHLR